MLNKLKCRLDGLKRLGRRGCLFGDEAGAVPIALRGTFSGFQAAGAVSLGELLLLDQHLRGSHDSMYTVLNIK